MTKAAYFTLGLAALMILPVTVSAQNTGDVGAAVNQSVLNQANTLVLRQKLADAQIEQQRGDIVAAAKKFQESFALAQQIGSGIDAETAQAVNGLTATSLALARDAQSRGDLREADARVKQALRADSKNPTALAFKKQNDALLAAAQGKMADIETLDRLPQIHQDKVDAGTLVQDGRLLYEAGKLEDAEAKLKEAQKLDPDNRGIIYYLELIQQTKYTRAAGLHDVDYQHSMEKVEKQWVPPTSSAQLPTPNAYATNNLVYTGPGRQAIYDKLSRIRLDNVSFSSLPLSEVVRQLAEKSKLRDPERKGINFLINPNPDMSGPHLAVTGGGGGFAAQPTAAPTTTTIDPATGLPVANAAASGSAEKIDISSQVTVTLNLDDVPLSQVLDAICQLADYPTGHQLKYSIQDFGIVFSDKGPETPQLITRSFKVDPNVFYSGLESVGSANYGSINSSGSSGGSSGGGGGGSGGNNQNNGGVVGVVNAFSGAGSLRSTGNGSGGGGGGGGGGGSGQGANNPLDSNQGLTGMGGAGGGGQNTRGNDQGGIHFVTQVSLSQMVSVTARNFFNTLGVNLSEPPGKSVFFNDKNGMLLVHATEDDLDIIEQALKMLNEVAPQVHIKARFIEEQQKDDRAFGFNWYLGQFNIGGNVVGQGGSSSSLYTTPSAANPSGIFPGTTLENAILPSTSDQWVTAGLRNALNAPAVGTITGILTNPNFQVALQMLQQRTGIEQLAEPEIVTTSGRQTQVRATQLISIISGFDFQQGSAPQTSGTATQ